MNKNGTIPLDALDRNMDRILSESLPDALNQLSQRHESFGQVVQYLEDNYITSQRSADNDKLLIENDAKKYVAKGLVSVLKDIEVASLNIDQLIQMQTMSIDSITHDVDLITTRLNNMKKQHLLTSLDGMKVSYTNYTATGQSEEDNFESSIKRIPVDYVQDTDLYDAEESIENTPVAREGNSSGKDRSEAGQGRGRVELPALEPRKRIAMEDRLASLSAIGTSSSD